jgi:FAD:protein FMN transferase
MSGAATKGGALALVGVLALAAGGHEGAGSPLPREIRRARHLMGSRCEVVAWGPHEDTVAAAAEAALDEVARLDALLSDYREDSELSLLNRLGDRGRMSVSADLAAFLREAIDWARLSDGTFDPTVGALIAAWDLRGAGRIPSPPELERALAATGYQHLHLGEGPTAWFDVPGVILDPGAIGKGYALDLAARVLEAHGVHAALLELGGQYLALDPPPGKQDWRVAVADPGDRERPVLLLRLRRQSIATSGQSERGVRVGSRRLGHILDPRRGVPVDWPGQVTVLAAQATAADVLSTVALVRGPGVLSTDDALPPGVGLAVMDSGGEGGRVRVFANTLFASQVVSRREGAEMHSLAEAGPVTGPAAGPP